MKSESNRPITIEDLLRLKRAERPPTEFWATFDQKLRAKQLSALVGKRPWWQRVPTAFRRLGHFRVAFGASAMAVLAFVSLRESEAPGSANPVSVVEPSVEAVAALLPAASDSMAPTTAADVPPSSVDPVRVEPVTVAQTSDAGAPVINRTLPMGGPSLEAGAEVSSSAARHTTATLAVMHVSDRSSARSLLAVPSGFEDRAMPSRVAVEPLQQMTPPGDSRRARMLTAMVSTASLESSMRTTERAASRIAQERLYDDPMSRFGARGDRLQVKF